MLAVVEDDQRLPAREARRNRIHERTTRLLARSKRACDRRRDEHLVVERCQVDEPHAQWVSDDSLGSDAEGEAGLSAASGAGERDEAVLVQQAVQLGAFALTSDEAAQLERQVVPRAVPRQRGHARSATRPSRSQDAVPTPSRARRTLEAARAAVA